MEKKQKTFIQNEIEDICSQYNIKCMFETEPQEKPKVLSYFDLMSSCQGVYIKSLDSRKNIKILESCIGDSKENYTDLNYCAYVREKMEDKYNLFSFPCDVELDSVIILPGSNILDIIVDDFKLIRAVSDGAYVKPHPFTSAKDIQYLEQMFGNKVLNKDIGGCEVIKKAKKVYTTGSSELALYSILLGKVVIDISKDVEYKIGSYQSIYTILTRYPHYIRPIILEQILSHKNSGIFFPFDIEEKNLENFILDNF
ncbi:MAG: hypothetical protein ACRC6B_08100 [Fusobacteriaceae bacterium]